ncbi:MAG: hypothetical protein ACPGUE_08020 [Marinomonas sp.]|jgi:hypothetical protein|uniref:hypothetical protein n=1 Tax=unclassified Marinomonas TaxID=196814 RepID=UPI0005FA8F32|nr:MULTISPECIES: hypothetical protein [unclassified Marinomonas]KJZ12416.1 hypothetical protein TW85_14935 [Marinomonas sp. S3726]KZM45183.1 hypothetical protein OA92_04905 [Marinomonas sp. SBI22]KZM46881.1 hypothetical protein OA91_03960 [Marinomonas sp. SBI8L]
MTFIALLNAIKNYFERIHAQRALKHLDSHSLKDIGFYNDEGHIRPLSGDLGSLANKVKISTRVIKEDEPIPQRSDG